MDAFYAYSYATAAWLGLQAIPLTLFPKLIITLLATEGHYASDLEIYFSRSLGFHLFTIASMTLFYTGSLPSPGVDTIATSNSTPLLLLTSLHHFVILAYTWVRYTSTSQSGYLLGSIPYMALTCMGGWCLMFGGERSGHRSKRTGADKRTAGWPFKSEKAYDRKRDKGL